VLGGGALAGSCAEALAHAGAAISLIAPDGLAFAPPSGAGVFSGWTVHSVHGAARVAALTIAAGERRERLLADALILAHRRIPMRNIEGAVLPGPGIVFCQPASDPKRDDDLFAEVAHAQDEVSALIGRARRPAAPVAARTEVKR
jgi:hypothetical protein